MQKLKKHYLDSMKELTVTRNLTLCGLMAALAIVLNYTTSIFITPNIRIGFSGYPNRIVEYMFGPFVGAIFGAVLDILKYFLKPDGGAFFFGYTFNVMVAGVIYGSILHRKPVRVWRIFIAEFLVKLIVNCGLNTLWIAVLGGKSFVLLTGEVAAVTSSLEAGKEIGGAHVACARTRFISLILNKSEFSGYNRMK